MSLKISSTVIFFQLNIQFLIPKIKHKGGIKDYLIALAYIVH